MQVHAPEYYRPKVRWRTPERDAYFRENREVDVVTLAENMHLNLRFVLSYMQKLGLRPMSGNPQATYRKGANPKGLRHDKAV